MKFKTEISALVYKRTKNRYNTTVSIAKSNYFQQRIAESEGNTKKLYTVISDLLCWISFQKKSPR